MWAWLKRKQPNNKSIRPPKVGGTRVPDYVLRIDFNRLHDFHFKFYNGGEKVFRSCVLIGFTTPMDDEGNRVGGGNEWGGHDRWLVLRQTDSRLAYVPRDALQFLEDSQTESGKTDNRELD